MNPTTTPQPKPLASGACWLMASLPFPIHVDELPATVQAFLARWIRPNPKSLTRQDWRDLSAVLAGRSLPEARRAALKAKIQ